MSFWPFSFLVQINWPIHLLLYTSSFSICPKANIFSLEISHDINANQICLDCAKSDRIPHGKSGNLGWVNFKSDGLEMCGNTIECENPWQIIDNYIQKIDWLNMFLILSLNMLKIKIYIKISDVNTIFICWKKKRKKRGGGLQIYMIPHLCIWCDIQNCLLGMENMSRVNE